MQPSLRLSFNLLLTDSRQALFHSTPGPEDINYLSCPTQLRMECPLLINMKFTKTVGIFIFVSQEILSYVW